MPSGEKGRVLDRMTSLRDAISNKEIPLTLKGYRKRLEEELSWVNRQRADEDQEGESLRCGGGCDQIE